jgi:hypothetical protein
MDLLAMVPPRPPLDLASGLQGEGDVVVGEEGATGSRRRGEEAEPRRRDKSRPAVDLPVVDTYKVKLYTLCL